MNILATTFSIWIKLYCYNNNLILNIKRNIKSKVINNLILFILSPYLIARFILLKLYEISYGCNRVSKLNETDNKRTFKYELAMVCISKNEGPYLKEWIEYHKLIGVSKFYFYDNESEDDTYDILKPYISSGLVEYSLIKGKAQQLNAYNDAINKHKYDCRYMAFLDMDEYLFIIKDNKLTISENITDLLINAGKGASGLSINWCVFGSSNYEKRPKGLITESYIYRGAPNNWVNFHVKTICNPRRVKKYISPHYPLYKIGAYSIDCGNLKRQYGWFCHNVNWSHFRINHYYCKSKEDYIIKTSRGLGDRVGNYDSRKFKMYDLNDIKDDSIIKFSEQIKNNI